MRFHAQTCAMLHDVDVQLCTRGTCNVYDPRSDEKIRMHCDAIMKLHDQMADLKSYFDGKGEMTPQTLDRTQNRMYTYLHTPPSYLHTAMAEAPA